MKLLIFTIICSVILFFIEHNSFFMLDLFLLSSLNFIVYILTFAFPFLGLLITWILVTDIRKKDFNKYYTPLFVLFILFCIGIVGFINAIQFEPLKYNKTIIFLIFSVSLLSLKTKNIKYIGSSFILMMSFLMRYYFLF